MDIVYHQLPVEELITILKTNAGGLTQGEVTIRQKEFGLNSIPQPKTVSLLRLFFRQFLSPLIYVLIAAGIISGFTGDIQDAIFITVIIVINAALGTYQEWRGENCANALRNLVKVNCRVKRD